MDHEIFGILDSPEQEGYIRMRKPSVFIFPGGKGDSAFFCVDDYTVLVNGGSLNRPWFWRLIRHHCRLDCMISTHLGTDSLVGLNSLFTRKVEEKNLKLPECENDDYKRLLRHLISPEMGLFFVNFPKHLSVEDTRSQEEVQVVQETMKLTKKLNMLVRPLVSKTSMEPITLFMKAGIGKLDLYPLLPEHGNKGLAHIYDKYGATDKFSVDDRMMSDLASICCLLVWHPESANDNIIRVLFPGNAKQDAILEAFERVKQLDFLRHPQPTPASLKELKKKAAAASKPSSATGAAMKRTNNARNISSAPAGATRNTKTTTTTTSRKPAPRPNTATSRVGLHNKQQRPGTVPSSTTNKKTETTTTSNKPTSKSATTARQRTTTKPTTARPASARPATTTTKPTTTNGAAKKEPATKTTTSTNMRGAKKAAAPAAAKSSAPALSKTQATSKKAPATTAASRGAKPATTTTTKKTTTTTMSKSKTAANAAAAAAKAKKTDAEKAAAPIKKKPAPVVAPVEKKLPVAPVEEKMLQKRPSPEGEDGDREKVFIEATAAAVKKPLSPVIGGGKPHDEATKQTKQPASCGDYLSLDAAVDEPPATKQAPIGGETTTVTTRQPDVVCKELAVEPDVVAEPNVAKQEPDVITQIPDYKKDEPTTTQAVTPEKTPAAAAPVMVTEEPDLLKEKPDVVASEPDVVQQQQQDIVVDKAATQQQQISTYVDDIGDGLMNTPPPSMDSISKSTTTGGATSSEKMMVFGNDDTVIDTDDLLTPQDNNTMLSYAFDAATKQQQIIMDEDGMPETPITTTTTTNKPADLVLTTTTSQQQMTSQSDLPPSPLNPDAVPFVPISPTNSIHQSSSSSSLVTPNDHVIIDDPFTMTSPSEGEKKMATTAPRLDLTGSDERLGLGESPMSVCGSSLATTTDVTSPVHPQQQQPSSVASSPLVVNASYARDVTMMMTSGGSAAFASEHDFKFDDGLVDDDGKMGRMSTSSSATLSRGGEDTGSSAQVVARIDSPHTATDDSAFTSYMMSSLSANFTNDETISQPPSTTQLSTAAGGDPHMQTTDDNGNHHHHTMTSSHQQQGATRKQQDSPVYDVDRYGAAILRFTDDMLLAQHRCNYTSSVEGDKQQRKFTSPPDDISAVFGVPPHYNDSDVSPTAPLAPADLMDVTDDDQISSPEGANMMMGQQQSNNNSTTTMDNNSTRMDNNSTTTAIMDNNPFLLDFSSNATPDPAFVLKPNQADPQMPAVTTSNRTPGMKKKPTSSSASGDKKSSTSSLVNYIDFTYVPHHAHPDYVGKNFFAKVRSRYYVLSGMEDEGSTQVLDGLLQGVKSWKDENSRNVTVIPTHDSESLARWFQSNYDELQSTNIHMVASNCKVVMHNETIEACKIEF